MSKIKKEVFFRKGDIALDPFCGSGTTLVQANELGIHALGVDVSAFNAFISNVTVKKVNLANLRQESHRITSTLREFVKDGKHLAFEEKLLAFLNEYNNQYFPSPEFKIKVRKKEIDEKTLLMVVSDHGFKSFSRCVNLNAWLHQNGYLTLKPGKTESGDWFDDVDWSRTRAYTMGLNGLYLNLKGREREGVIEPGTDADALKEELRRKLDGLVDPASGRVGITGVFDCDSVYAGPYVDNAPDLIVGYGEGFRASWDSVMGKVTSQIFEDNLKAWSGDHCIDPRLVPGVLFCNQKITDEKPAIVDVAPTLLKLFGLALPGHLDGKAWTVGTPVGTSTGGSSHEAPEVLQG